MPETTNSKNQTVLEDFTEYCKKHPEERFWQALRNWSNALSILYKDSIQEESKDTFYWQGKGPWL